MAIKTPPVGQSKKVLDFPTGRIAKTTAKRASGPDDSVRLSKIIGESKGSRLHPYGKMPPDVSQARQKTLLAHDLSAVPKEVRENIRVMLETGLAEDGPLSRALKKFLSS